MTDTKQAIESVLTALLEVAREEGEAERARLGRELTEAEAANLAAMVERQFRLALASR